MQTIIIIIASLFIVKYLWTLDIKDRTHPFGLDDSRNKLTHLKGEMYGVSTCWGKPNGKDTLFSRLNKIEWLSTVYENEVFWRRAICFGIAGSLILQLGQATFKIESTILFGLTITLFVYFSHMYYNHHIMNIKSRYIKKHISKMKKHLNLSTDNPIYGYI